MFGSERRVQQLERMVQLLAIISRVKAMTYCARENSGQATARWNALLEHWPLSRAP